MDRARNHARPTPTALRYIIAKQAYASPTAARRARATDTRCSRPRAPHARLHAVHLRRCDVPRHLHEEDRLRGPCGLQPGREMHSVQQERERRGRVRARQRIARIGRSRGPRARSAHRLGSRRTRRRRRGPPNPANPVSRCIPFRDSGDSFLHAPHGRLALPWIQTRQRGVATATRTRFRLRGKRKMVECTIEKVCCRRSRCYSSRRAHAQPPPARRATSGRAKRRSRRIRHA